MRWTPTPEATVEHLDSTPTPTITTTPAPTPVPEAKSKEEPHKADCGTWGPDRREPPEGMEVTLELDGAIFAQGEEVRMTLRAKNTSAEPIENAYSPPRADFWVKDGERRIWVLSFGRAYPAVWNEETFAPGEEKAETVVWEQRLCDPESRQQRDGPPPPGRYVARGGWAADKDRREPGKHAWWATR